MTTPPSLTIRIVRRTDPDVVEREWAGLEWRASMAFFPSGVSARTLPNGRVATSSYQRMVFMEPISCRWECGSGCCVLMAEPFDKIDAAEACFSQRDERKLLGAAAEVPVPGLGVTHDLTRVTNRLQVAGDDVVERRSFRPGDLDDAVSWRCLRHIGNDGSNVVRSDRLEQAGKSLTVFPSALEAAMAPRNSKNWVARMMV